MCFECMFVCAGKKGQHVLLVCVCLCACISHTGLGIWGMLNVYDMARDQPYMTSWWASLASFGAVLPGNAVADLPEGRGEGHFQIVSGQWITCLYNCLVVYLFNNIHLQHPDETMKVFKYWPLSMQEEWWWIEPVTFWAAANCLTTSPNRFWVREQKNNICSGLLNVTPLFLTQNGPSQLFLNERKRCSGLSIFFQSCKYLVLRWPFRKEKSSTPVVAESNVSQRCQPVNIHDEPLLQIVTAPASARLTRSPLHPHHMKHTSTMLFHLSVTVIPLGRKRNTY